MMSYKLILKGLNEKGKTEFISKQINSKFFISESKSEFLSNDIYVCTWLAFLLRL